MAKSRANKEQTLAALKEKLAIMKVVVFSHFEGLTVKDVTELRRLLRAEQVEVVVAKKTILRKALQEAKLDAAMVDRLPGSLSMSVGYADEVTPAKLLQQYAKTHPQLELIGGIIEGNFIDAKQVLALAKLPSRLELRAKLVGTINAPVSGFVNVLAGNLRSLVYALQALHDKKSAPGAA